ncbi:MAG: DNA alkylation repair protein [Bryobacteraceae bacterium]
MTLAETMAALESMGTAQNRKVYARHGYPAATFGVSYANLGKLAKRIRKDHDLAVALWGAGNSDARALALMVADPDAASEAEIDAWMADTCYYVLAGALAGYVHKTRFAQKKRKQWTGAKEEFTRQAGWDLVAHAAMQDDSLDDAYFERQLETIEKKIGRTPPNRVRHAMNSALIAIGVRNPRLRKLAEAAAGRIGKVEVDHGETGCKTPDAVSYIARTMARSAKRSRPR